MITQGAVGGAGSKAVTEFTDFLFNSFAQNGAEEFGASSDGLFLLNKGPAPRKVVTFAYTDLGLTQNKKLRYIYFGMFTEVDANFDLTITVDESITDTYSFTTSPGFNRTRVPLGRNLRGRYWEFTLETLDYFKLDQITAVVKPLHKGAV